MKKLLFSLAAIAALVGCDEKTDDPIVYDITLEPAAVTLFAGDTHTLKAEITPATNMSLIWTSSDDSIVKVADGVIVAIAAGNATVTAALNCADGYFESTCEVSVIDVPTVTLDIMSAVIGTGDTKTVTATVVPALGGGISLDWKSSDTSVATVADGTITGVAEGTATITAKLSAGDKTFEGKCELTVKQGYEIGQIIDFDGVKGIVFWLTDGDTAGKAVSLDESGAILWATTELNCNAGSEDDGEENTERIKEVGLQFHPAAKWCTDLGSGWYMPAINEGIAWVTKAGILNPTITANGGKAIKDSAYDWYWSSTEGEHSPEAEAICFYGGTSSGHSYGDFKKYPEADNFVRAVHKF